MRGLVMGLCHWFSGARVGWLYALGKARAGKADNENGGGGQALVHGILPVADPYGLN
jgi:hypothetical protein